MKTYQPTELGAGNWAIEKFVNGASQGPALGHYKNRDAATYVANMLVRMDMLDTTRFWPN